MGIREITNRLGYREKERNVGKKDGGDSILQRGRLFGLAYFGDAVDEILWFDG